MKDEPNANATHVKREREYEESIEKLKEILPLSKEESQPMKEERIPSYEYCSVLCDVIDDLLIEGGARELDRSVGLFHKMKTKLEEAGFKIIRNPQPHDRFIPQTPLRLK